MSKVTCIPGRLAFPYLFAPRKNKDHPGNDKFEATILVSVGDKIVKSYVAECLKVASEKFGGEAESRKVLQNRPILKKGDDKPNPPVGFAGMLYIAARSKTMPDFFSADRKRLTVEQARKLFYAGCKVILIVKPWAYNTNGNRGISHELIAIQFAGHADAFSSRPQVSAEDLPDLSAEGNDSFDQSDDSNVDDLL